MSIQGTSKLMWCIEFVVSWTYNLSRKESEIFFIGCLAVKIMQNDTCKSEEFDLKQFQNPSTEFRGAPFWAWNTKLDKTELLRQIDCFHQMGFGGFFMHSRAGMATKYLGEEFILCVRACVEYAEKLGMKANLYDEDRWPSGFAGGYVTEDKNLRQMQICLSLKAPEEFLRVYRDFERDPHLLTVYDIVFDDYDRLADYHIISADAQAKEFIDSVGGMSYGVSVRGNNLSGGQKQRLLIARALAKNPEILILDDASSALDYRTDAVLRKALAERYSSTTSIIVAQRISSIKGADLIIVLEGGRMIGRGTHDELMENCPVYRDIAETQMGTGGEAEADE